MLWWRSRYRHHHRTSLRSLQLRRFARSIACLVAVTCVVAWTSACGSDSNSSGINARDINTHDISASTGSTPSGELTPARVVDVVDGDTVVLRINNHTETVRLIGIDTPETVHPTKPVECFGPEASTYLDSLLPRDTKVRISRDVEARDYYDRLLLYVFRESDNLFINQHMVETGHAVAYPFAPNTTFARTFAAMSHDARAAKVGLWGTCPR